MDKILTDDSKIAGLVELIKRSKVPQEPESTTHSFQWTGDLHSLANSYFAIVAICHQTTPIGERRLEGHINGTTKYGWDYLKEKFLTVALRYSKWASCDYWQNITPVELSELYNDEICGKTLNRVSERTFLLNDLGNLLKVYGYTNIADAFAKYHHVLGGELGFLNFLKMFEAYKDPVMKKSLFFVSLMLNECQWSVQDLALLSSPIDYHELRGHLRIGTLVLQDKDFAIKVQNGLVITEEEDIELRTKVQVINDKIAQQAGLSSSRIHYLFWNIFRNCCPRESSKTHCTQCGSTCTLIPEYKAMLTYESQCLFAGICDSANKHDKVIEPAYKGHYY